MAAPTGARSNPAVGIGRGRHAWPRRSESIALRRCPVSSAHRRQPDLRDAGVPRLLEPVELSPAPCTRFTEAARYVPPALARAGLTLGFRLPQRIVTTVATNVPGPREPRYGLGRRLLELYPYVPIADRVRTAVAIMSYCGRLYVGVTADRNSTPDIGVLADGIATGIADLRGAAATVSLMARR